MSTRSRRLLELWQRLSPWPGGRTLFGWFLRWSVPYSGTVLPRVLVLEPGYARIAMTDRRRVRNHLNSVHAIALANVAELAGGLAMTTTLPADVRGLVVAIRVEYLKKARGTLIAESRCVIPEITGDVEHEVVSQVADESGDIVARATVAWRLGRSASKVSA